MKLAIMQPYFLPYLGYFQLVAQVDRFVFYDDVNFIKNGWINRNRVLLKGRAHYITIPLRNASSFSRISAVGVQPSSQWRRKLLETVRQAYGRAPSFEAVFHCLEEILDPHSEQLGEIAKRSVGIISRFLGLPTEFVWSSSCYANDSLTGQSRLIDICLREGAKDYWNLPGGRDLYSADEFREAGVALHFVIPQLPEYDQRQDAFLPGLSILDILMWNDRETAMRMVRSGAQETADCGRPT